MMSSTAGSPTVSTPFVLSTTERTEKRQLMLNDQPWTRNVTSSGNMLSNNQPWTMDVTSSVNMLSSFSNTTSLLEDESPNNSAVQSYDLTGWDYPSVAEVGSADHIFGPTVSVLSFFTAIVVVVTFMRKSMRSPTTILLTGVVVFDTVKSLSRYGNYLYVYLKYGSGTIEIVLPYCIVFYWSGVGERICSSSTKILWTCIAFQRIIVIRYPFKSRRFLTKTVSKCAVLGSLVLSGVYLIPNILYSARFMSFQEYLKLQNINPADVYYYYYYYYYYDVTGNATGETQIEQTYYDTIHSSEDYCMVYKNPDFNKIFILYNTILMLIPFAIILTSCIFITYSMINRTESKKIHESKRKLEKIEMMTRSVLFMMLVQIVKKIIKLFFQISVLFSTYGVYDIWEVFDTQTIKIYIKVHEAVDACTSLIVFWLTIAACEQFRNELKKIFCRCVKGIPRKEEVGIGKKQEGNSSMTGVVSRTTGSVYKEDL